MNLPKFFSRIIVSTVCVLTLAGAAFGQYRASIQGVVTDAQGATISGATLTLKNLDTNQILTATTDDNGIYNFNALPPNQYSLTVEKEGFAKKVIDKLGVIAEQANALNIQLDVGGVTQTVTVSGDSTPAIDTQTASISGTISDKQIQNMPSFGRDVFQLIQLAPGVFGDRAQGNGGGAANLPGTQGPGATGGNQGIFQTENGPQALAAGQQYENNSVTIDGISTTSAVWGGTTIITPTEDSVDSVKVVSNSYDAENGRFSGAQIQVISKSGTNEYHGSAFFTAHRPGLNAFQRFNGQGNSVLRDNNFFSQFGASGGGPILKDKIFAFFAWETVRSPKAQTNIANGWYETPAFAALGPSGSIAAKYLTFPGSGVVSTGINNSTCANAGLTEGVNCRTIPGQGLNLGSPLTASLGTQDFGWTDSQHPGTGGDGLGGSNNLSNVADIANYITASTTHFSKNQYNGRVDANVTQKDRLGFALYYVPQDTSFLNGPARAYNFFHHSQINEAFSLIWDHTISSSFVNEFRTNAAGWRWNEINSNPQSPVGLPSDHIDQIGSITLSSFGPNVGSILNQWTYAYKDVATKIIGRHTIKFGGEVTRLFYLQDCAGCGVPNYGFFNLWDFLNDAPHNEGGGFNPTTGFPTTIRQDQRENIWGLFVQDDFKLRRNLTVNLGLRWSYFGPLSSKESNMLKAIPGAGANYLTGLVIRKGHSWDAEKNDFGPQIGVAWSPSRFRDKLVVRGGYGLSYNQEEIAISANISNNPGLVVFPSLNMSTPGSANPGIIYATSADAHSLGGYPANPNTVSSFGANGLPTTGSVGVQIFPGTLPTQLVHHYSTDVQYDLGHSFIATLGYQGSISRNLFFHENPNAAPAALGLTLNPQIGGGDYWGVSGRANYNAMLLELNHRFSHQFMADAQFTWAKSMDTSSGPYFEQPYPYDLGLNYGRSDFNVGKAFKLFGMWQPVIFRGSNSWLEKIAGGWTLSGILTLHSGFPWNPVVSVQGGSLYCGTCGYGVLFPAAYLGGAGTSTSNDAFKTGSNFPNGGAAYFSTPTYTAYSGTNFGNALPQSPGVHRNSWNGPGYRDVDLTLAKAFGLPKAPILGESARIEFRLDAYNVFNNLNFNPTSISNNIANANFGQATSALGARVVTLGARFNF
ncbi:MAG TPA: TonB-dependent receptor [Candidatus Acidoferrum sp.]|nr:TonB-dependent receptor [Candidatus Acidoferrum sp.]